MKMKNICELARTVRSKNAGYFNITLEIIFADRDTYQRIKNSGYITQDTIAKIFGVTPEKVKDFTYFDPGMGIKANFSRDEPSGGPGETDVYGCQQYAPLLTLEIPWEE